MDPLNMTAAGGLRSRLESLDMLANNLANSATVGYKRDSEFYGVYMSQLMTEEGADRDPVTPSMPVIERYWTDYSQGELAETGSSSDIAISGKGFFEVAGPKGPLYTRNGRFKITADGAVQTEDGYAVLTAAGAALRVSPSKPFQISTDGTVTQAGNVLGQLKITALDNSSGITKFGGTYFQANGTPAAANNYQLLQGHTESSNVGVADSAIRLVNITRQYEMLNRAATMCGDMSKQAIEELGRINS